MKMTSSKVKKKKAIILANFGGPRDLKEITPFLKELLCDQEVVRTPLPQQIHRLFFSKIAKKRSKKIAGDYRGIGGKSPIYDETEKVASLLRQRLNLPLVTFHRYLPATHRSFIRSLEALDVDEFLVFPMFPQFSYSTSGSIAKWFDHKLPKKTKTKIFWLKSYPSASAYIDLYCNRIDHFLKEKKLNQGSLILLFSAHGLPARFVIDGDPYQRECERSFEAISSFFPEAQSLLCYQSKFGPGEWLKPYTSDMCLRIDEWAQHKKHVVFIPLAFTSDHIETLHEVETEYMPMVRNKGFEAYRLPAFNHGEDWIDAIEKLLQNPEVLNNQMLIRRY